MTHDSTSNDPKAHMSVNDLVQARIQGKLSRRQMLVRAAQLGIAAPVIGVMLHATSDMAFGAPVASRANLSRLNQDAPLEITGPTAPEGTPKQGGQIIVGTTEEPDTLHPFLTQLVTGSDVYQGIIEPMLKYDSTQKLVPALAESYEIGDDGMTYTFHLRKDVTFHDGSAFTSADIKANFDVIMDPDFGAWDTTGWREIASVETPDDYTVVMVTSRVYAPFISYVGNGPICPKSAIDKGNDSFKQEFGRAPYGSGPFKFTEWKAKQSITLGKFDSYWGGSPYLDTIVYSIIPDTNTFMVQLKTGEIDLAASSGALGSLQVDEALGIDGITVFQQNTMAWSHLDLKNIGHLRQTKVRQAIDFATPTSLIISQLLKNRVAPSIADQAPGTWAFDDTIQQRPFDQDQAAQLLTEAGLTKNGDGVWEGPTPAGEPIYPGRLYVEAQATPSAQPFTSIDDVDATNLTGPVMPLEVDLWGVAGDEQSMQVLQTISAAWTQIGIKTSVNVQDVSTLWGPEGYTWTDKMTACLYSWFNGNDPDNTFYWNTNSIPDSPTGSGGNANAYFFPYSFQSKIDELTTAGATETDQTKRTEIYKQLQALVHEEVPNIFMWWSAQFPVVKPTIGGFWPSAYNRLLWNAEKWYFV